MVFGIYQQQLPKLADIFNITGHDPLKFQAMGLGLRICISMVPVAYYRGLNTYQLYYTILGVTY